MGFSVSGSHVIFFIAALIIAGTVSGIFVAVTLDISSSISERGYRFKEQLDTDFKIINDPNNIPDLSLSPELSYYIFYIKNIGGKRLITTTETFQVFVDGELIASTYHYFQHEYINVAEVTSLYIRTSMIANGDRTLLLVGPQGVKEKFEFTI